MMSEEPLFPTHLANAQEFRPEPTGTPRLDLFLQKYLEDGSLPPASERPSLIRYIQRLSIDAAVHGNYDDADRYSELHRKFYEACVESESHERVKTELEAIDARMAAAESDLASVRQNWDEILAEARRAERERMEKLIDAQGSELAEFDAKWSTDESLRPFAKQSADLLELRMKEKNMLLAKMFKEADVLRRRGDEIEAEETRAAQARAEKEALMQRMQVLSRQNREIEQARAKSGARMEVLEQRREHEIALAQQRISKLQAQKALVAKSRRRDTETALKMSEGAGKLSPRSHRKMEMYKRGAAVARLTIKPIATFPKLSSRTLRMPKHKV